MSRKGKKRWGTLVVLGILGLGVYLAYNYFILNKARLKDRAYVYVYVGREDDFEDVMEKIDSEGLVGNFEAFEWLAKQMDLPKNIHPGKFRINNGMNARQIINLLKYNKQEKVKLSYNSQIRNLEEFIEYTDLKLEMSSEEVLDWLEDEKKLEDNFGLNPGNAFGLVAPGVVEAGWAVQPDELFAIFREKYRALWTQQRRKLANQIGYSVPEIATLASIVQCESGIAAEQSKIAGVYINRLRKGMPLQADPTLKYANGNFDAQRLYNGDKETDSPYNTYKYKGLPPGPIALVGTQAIDATLNYKKHNFLFFCAKPGLNGYSDFSVSFDDHRKLALAYQKALNEKGINR